MSGRPSRSTRVNSDSCGLPKSPVVEIKLSWRVLLRNQESWCLDEKLLLVIIFHWRLLIELDDRRLFCDRDFRSRTSGMMCCRIFAQIVVRRRSRNRFSRNSDLSCFRSLSVAIGRLPTQKQNQNCERQRPIDSC